IRDRNVTGVQTCALPISKLQGMPGLLATLPAIEASQRQPMWNLRNAAVPLLLSVPGDRKPVAFIEDTAVAPRHLPGYVARFRERSEERRVGKEGRRWE